MFVLRIPVTLSGVGSNVRGKMRPEDFLLASALTARIQPTKTITSGS